MKDLRYYLKLLWQIHGIHSTSYTVPLSVSMADIINQSCHFIKLPHSGQVLSNNELTQASEEQERRSRLRVGSKAAEGLTVGQGKTRPQGWAFAGYIQDSSEKAGVG